MSPADYAYAKEHLSEFYEVKVKGLEHFVMLEKPGVQLGSERYAHKFMMHTRCA